MANNEWKPLYNYEVSFFTQIGFVLSWILIAVLFTATALVVNLITMCDGNAAAAFMGAFMGIAFIALGIMLIRFLYFNSPSYVKKNLQKYGIESYCKKNGLILARTPSQNIGLFTTTGYLIIKPEYRSILFRYHYYLLEDQRGMWGVYNITLSKQILGCEYSSIRVEENENIIVVKDEIRYTFSPYGSLIHKVNVSTGNLINSIMGKL